MRRLSVWIHSHAYSNAEYMASKVSMPDNDHASNAVSLIGWFACDRFCPKAHRADALGLLQKLIMNQMGWNWIWQHSHHEH